MNSQEALKLGFLARCVESGMSSEETHKLIKVAHSCFTKKGFSSIIDTARSAAVPALAAALIAPPALGGMSAYLVNKATDADANDVEEIKRKELVRAYRRMADQLRRHKKIRNNSVSSRGNRVFL